MDPHILVAHADGVATLTMHRPERKNALTGGMYRAMSEALAAAEGDPAVGAVLLLGQPSIFTAGNDIADFVRQPPTDMRSPPFRFLADIARFPKPIVAAVCGPAVGIGASMLLHCDLVVAASDASFAMPFVDLGLCPEAASSLLLPQAVGARRAAAMLLLGERLDARTACAAGFVNAVAEPDEAQAIAREWARKLASKPAGAVLETKRLMRQGLRPLVERQMADECETFVRLLAQPGAQDAFAAFAARRKDPAPAGAGG